MQSPSRSATIGEAIACTCVGQSSGMGTWCGQVTSQLPALQISAF
jgi:hypothetical protein